MSLARRQFRRERKKRLGWPSMIEAGHHPARADDVRFDRRPVREIAGRFDAVADSERGVEAILGSRAAVHLPLKKRAMNCSGVIDFGLYPAFVSGSKCA